VTGFFFSKSLQHHRLPVDPNKADSEVFENLIFASNQTRNTTCENPRQYCAIRSAPHLLTVNVQLTAWFTLVGLVVEACGQVAVMSWG